MDQTNFHAIVNLEEALKTYIDRNKKYGNNYKRFGHVMMALFPDGLTLASVDDFNRYGVIFMKIAKLSRYVTNPKVGHQDSVHDDIVYSAMLEELDAEIAGLYVEPPVKLVTTVKPGDAFEMKADPEVVTVEDLTTLPVFNLGSITRIEDASISATHQIHSSIVLVESPEAKEARLALEPPIGSSTFQDTRAAAERIRKAGVVGLREDLG
jgi:hypothetical protein